MDRIFHSHKDLMLEAMGYLGLLAGDTSLDAALNRLEGLYAQTGSAPRFKERMEPVRTLFDIISRRHTPEAKELERFFRPFSIGQGSLSQMLVISFYEPAIADWSGQVENIRSKFSEYASSKAPSLQRLNIGRLFDDTDTDGKEEPRPLIEQLDDTGLSDAEKWQILRVIQDAGPFLDQLTALLMPVKALIEENLSLVQPALDDYATRWQTYFEKVPFETFLSENIGMEAGDLSGYTLNVYPSIFDCGAIYLSMDSQTKTIYMQIGVCLQEGVNVKALPLASYQLLEGLKALSDKSKLSILSHIRDKRSYGQALAKETGLSTATISHHMSALINCGFIRLERVENRIYYQMDKENLGRFLKKLTLYLLSGEGADVPLS
jgi:DNA-binding transcriptional ArsR family regulator